MENLQEFEKRLAELERRERDVARREIALEAKSLRHNLYDRIPASSAKWIDHIIAVCVVALFMLIVIGILMART